MKTKARILTLILTLAMLISIFAVLAVPASAEGTIKTDDFLHNRPTELAGSCNGWKAENVSLSSEETMEVEPPVEEPDENNPDEKAEENNPPAEGEDNETEESVPEESLIKKILADPEYRFIVVVDFLFIMSILVAVIAGLATRRRFF